MRFFSFLLPLTLLLSLKLVSAGNQSSIIGNWTNPTNNTDVSPFCCIPNSIVVQSNGTDRYVATFNSGALGEKGFSVECFTLFRTFLGVGNMTLAQSDTDPNSYYSGYHPLGGWNFAFKVQSGPSLNVFIDSSEASNGCNFTMETKVGSEPDLSFLFPFTIIFIIAFFGCIIWKNYQKKQSSVLLKQNLVQPAFRYQYNPAPQYYYVPPTTNAQVEPKTTTNNNNNVSVAAPTNAQANLTTIPEEQFLQDYPKFI